MTTFSPNLSYLKIVFKNSSLFAGACIACLLFATLIYKTNIKNSNYWVLIGLILIQVVRDLIAKRICQIDFIEETKQVQISYTTWLFNRKQVIIPFATAAVVITTASTGVFLLKKNKIIHFLDHQTKLLEVSTEKDGFSADQIESIYSCAQTNGITISNHS